MSAGEQPRDVARRLAEASLARGDATVWFEQLYARAAGDPAQVPWADGLPSVHLLEWLAGNALPAEGRALVVGCGLGDDAEELSRRVQAVTAFDVSTTAVAWCRRRFPSSRVAYVQADLFAPPPEWRRHFDFVLESNTLQALPAERRAPAMAALADCIAPGGKLLVLARGRRPEEPPAGPPWPLLREELSALRDAGLVESSFEELRDGGDTPVRRFRVVFRAPAPGPDGVHRFDNRVDNYDRFRPRYPQEIVEPLRRAGLPQSGYIADIGSGTGKLTDVFLRAGYRVTGVEPGAPMRAAAERNFREQPGFTSAAGTAETTSLPAGSVDAIVAGQAFHWFEPRAARAEFRRILRRGADGFVALIWNDRSNELCPVLADYEALLIAHCPAYGELQRASPDAAALASFFAPAPMTVLQCPNRQDVDWEALLGRALSASYVPLAGPAHDALVAGLRASFERHSRGGRVTLLYDTRMFVGRIGAGG